MMEILHINYNDIVKEIKIARATSSMDIEYLLDKSRGIAKKMDLLQLINPNAIINKNHIYAAYINAYMNFIENKSVSNNISMEFLLCLSFTNQISTAIGISGIKRSNDFVLIASSEAILKQFCTLTDTSANSYEPYNNENMNAMHTFNINNIENPTKEILLKMSELKLNE